MSRPNKAIKEKKKEDEKKQLDRRKISEKSKQETAEAIENGDFEKAAKNLFEIITGKTAQEALE